MPYFLDPISARELLPKNCFGHILAGNLFFKNYVLFFRGLHRQGAVLKKLVPAKKRPVQDPLWEPFLPHRIQKYFFQAPEPFRFGADMARQLFFKMYM